MAADIERLNENTFMVDFGLFGIKRVGAAYLLRAERSCLVDSGTRKEARNIIRALDSIGAFPPDMLVLTHSHFDHSQGAPLLCSEASRRGKRIEVMASEKGIGNLADQSWNRVFVDKHKFTNIQDVTPLSDGQLLDLGGLELEFLDFAGHCADDIAVHDRSHKTLFVGDSLGYRVEHMLTFPPFMPPFFDEGSFRATVKRLEAIDFDQICLAHYGCLRGEEARRFPTETMQAYETWWRIFAAADKAGRLKDVPYLKQQLIKHAGVVLPDLELGKAPMRWVLTTLNVLRKLVGKKPIRVAEMQMDAIVTWLGKGFEIYAKGHPGEP